LARFSCSEGLHVKQQSAGVHLDHRIMSQKSFEPPGIRSLADRSSGTCHLWIIYRLSLSWVWLLCELGGRLKDTSVTMFVLELTMYKLGTWHTLVAIRQRVWFGRGQQSTLLPYFLDMSKKQYYRKCMNSQYLYQCIIRCSYFVSILAKIYNFKHAVMHLLIPYVCGILASKYEVEWQTRSLISEQKEDNPAERLRLHKLGKPCLAKIVHTYSNHFYPTTMCTGLASVAPNLSPKNYLYDEYTLILKISKIFLKYHVTIKSCAEFRADETLNPDKKKFSISYPNTT